MQTRLLFSAIALAVRLPAQQPPPAAPSNPNLDRMAIDRYTRSHDYDLVHQRIVLGAFDWDSTSFSGSVTTTIVALRPRMDSVVLDAGQLLVVRSVTSASGARLRQSRHGDTLVVHLAAPAAFRDTVRFTVDYAGRVDNGRGLTFIDARPPTHTPRQIWSQGEDHDNHLWFPTYDFPNDKMTWELEATVPAGYSAISNGSLVSDTRAAGRGGVHTMRWRQDKPSASYLVSLVVAPLAKVHDAWRGIPVDYYVYAPDSGLARALFHVTPDMIDVYSKLTGVPYPWTKYAQTTVADFFGGMENVSATTLIDAVPDRRAYQDRPWYQHILIPHELAHQWFGDYVTTENWANMWLNEGFAEFMPGQYWARRTGPQVEQDYYIDEYHQFAAIDARRRMPLASLGSNNIYPKGALVLEMLKHHLGEDRFWAGVNRYLTRNAFGTAITDDLRQAFLQATGENLDWFWDEWMYAAGYPDFTVDAVYDAPLHRVTLHVRQTQRDTLSADSAGMRYVVPEAFRMPVAVRVGTAGGDVVRQAWVRQREDTIVVDSVASAPTMVVFDDGNRILKTLAFDQPTEWLATQLRRDADLWNREWAIQQLARRPADPAAGAALAAAATSADYFLTRVEAVNALAKFPGDVALPALERAAKDTSSQVRQAAVAVLGQLGTGGLAPRALDLVRTAWRDDSSYAVRAVALAALARLDSTNRRSLITEGLATHSYQDAIQDAALRAIARLPDTSFVTQVQQLVGEQQLPVHALAALANRGSQRALDLLTGDLDDARPWVRQWALAAFAGSLDPARGLPALKAAQPSLTHADARLRVARAIEQLERAANKPQ
jgi:aminopeptidase N